MDIHGFTGEYRYLSNFWYAGIRLEPATWGNINITTLIPFRAKTNEHAYQALKCMFHADFEGILDLDSPVKAKRAGREAAQHKSFEEHKLLYMYQINRAKFTQHPALRMKLISTTGLLEETNTWGDQFWGVCDGVGQNNLGKILMKIREEIR